MVKPIIRPTTLLCSVATNRKVIAEEVLAIIGVRDQPAATDRGRISADNKPRRGLGRNKSLAPTEPLKTLAPLRRQSAYTTSPQMPRQKLPSITINNLAPKARFQRPPKLRFRIKSTAGGLFIEASSARCSTVHR